MKIYEQHEVIQMLRAVQGKRTLEQFAAFLEVSTSFLCKVYSGQKKPSARLLGVITPRIKAQRELRTVYVEAP